MHRYGTSTFPPGLIKDCPGMVGISLTLTCYLNPHDTVVFGTIYRPHSPVVFFGAKALWKSPGASTPLVKEMKTQLFVIYYIAAGRRAVNALFVPGTVTYNL